MSLSPGTRLGPYEVVAAVGAGGMGEVYRARDTRLDRDVAIKVLPAETPPAIRRLLKRCLTREPRSRLRDMDDTRIALEESLVGEANESGAPTSLQARRARRVTWALAALAVFASLFAASLFRSPPGPAFTPPVIRFPLASDPSPFVATGLTTPFAISPDGQTVVFTGTRGGAKPRLWVRSLNSPDARELEDKEDATQPAISPDGNWVAFFVHFNEIRKLRLSGASTRLGASTARSASGFETVTRIAEALEEAQEHGIVHRQDPYLW